MSATKTNGFVAPDGSAFDFMDYRIPTPGSGDEGKVPMYVGSTYFQWTKHVSAAEATATASTESYAASQGYGELSATLADVNPHGLIKVLYSYTPSQSFAVRFANDGSTYRSIKYRGAWLSTNDTGIIKSGDTALLWYYDNVLHLIAVDRAAQHKTILHNEVFGRGDFNVQDGFYFPNAVRDVGGNWYGAVIIGDQVWMAENLRTTKQPDGTGIAAGGSNTSSSTPYYYYPGNSTANVNSKGLLYNWPAVMNGESSSSANPSGVQGIAPSGWHIPSAAELTQLTDYVSAQTRYRADGSTASYIAKALADSEGWLSWNAANTPGNNQKDNNKTMFGAKNAGGRRSSSTDNFGGMSMIWSTLQNGDAAAYAMLISFNQPVVDISAENKEYALSVRCVCDMTPEQFVDWYVRTYGSMQHITDDNILRGTRITIAADGVHTVDLTDNSVTVVNFDASVTSVTLKFQIDALGDRQVILKRAPGSSTVAVSIQVDTAYKTKILSLVATGYLTITGDTPRPFTITNRLIDGDTCMLTAVTYTVSNPSFGSSVGATWTPPAS